METDEKLKHLIELALEIVNEQKKANLELDRVIPKLDDNVNHVFNLRLEQLITSSRF